MCSRRSYELFEQRHSDVTCHTGSFWLGHVLKYKIHNILAAQNLKYEFGQNMTGNNKCHQTF
jgi:hypothetical protein